MNEVHHLVMLVANHLIKKKCLFFLNKIISVFSLDERMGPIKYLTSNMFVCLYQEWTASGKQVDNAECYSIILI